MCLIDWIISAAIIGIIIAVMSKGEWPGWAPMFGCVLAISFSTNIATYFLPGYFSLLGVGVGAAVGACMIVWLCDMSWGRAWAASGIYFGVMISLSSLMMMLLS